MSARPFGAKAVRPEDWPRCAYCQVAVDADRFNPSKPTTEQRGRGYTADGAWFCTLRHALAFAGEAFRRGYRRTA